MKSFIRIVIVVAIFAPWQIINRQNGIDPGFAQTFLVALIAFGFANLVTWLIFDRKKVRPIEKDDKDIIDKGI